MRDKYTKMEVVLLMPERVTSRRTIGINEYLFDISLEVDESRENIHYFSDEFNKIVKFEEGRNNICKIQELFYEMKNNLLDLEWFVDDYY